MINKAILIGRITKSPELKKTTTGISVVQFTLACNRRFQNQDGKRDADFIECVAYRQSADFIFNYAKKGNQLGVEGRIQTRNYKDQSDRTVYVTEVVCENVQLLESRKDTPTPKEETQTNTYQQTQQASYEQYGSIGSDLEDTLDIASDDLPF